MLLAYFSGCTLSKVSIREGIPNLLESLEFSARDLKGEVVYRDLL